MKSCVSESMSRPFTKLLVAGARPQKPSARPARFNFLHLDSIARRRARVWPVSWRSTSREEKDETSSNAIEPDAILRRDGACDLRCASPRYRLRSTDRAERGNRLDGYLHRRDRSGNRALAPREE